MGHLATNRYVFVVVFGFCAPHFELNGRCGKRKTLHYVGHYAWTGFAGKLGAAMERFDDINVRFCLSFEWCYDLVARCIRTARVCV